MSPSLDGAVDAVLGSSLRGPSVPNICGAESFLRATGGMQDAMEETGM